MYINLDINYNGKHIKMPTLRIQFSVFSSLFCNIVLISFVPSTSEQFLVTSSRWRQWFRHSIYALLLVKINTSDTGFVTSNNIIVIINKFIQDFYSRYFIQYRLCVPFRHNFPFQVVIFATWL